MRGYFQDDVSDYTKEQCEEYLREHPNGLHAEYVRERLKIISPRKTTASVVNEEEEYWKSARNTIAGLKSYKSMYPQGKHLAECNALLKSKGDGVDGPRTASKPQRTIPDAVPKSEYSQSSGSNGYEIVGKVVLTVLILGAFFMIVILIKENVSSSGWKTVAYGGGATIVSPLLKKIWDK